MGCYTTTWWGWEQPCLRQCSLSWIWKMGKSQPEKSLRRVLQPEPSMGGKGFVESEPGRVQEQSARPVWLKQDRTVGEKGQWGWKRWVGVGFKGKQFRFGTKHVGEPLEGLNRGATPSGVRIKKNHLDCCVAWNFMGARMEGERPAGGCCSHPG